ncbi:MAG: hypothetical protein U1F15_09465 [Burkholderiales bacterium]
MLALGLALLVTPSLAQVVDAEAEVEHPVYQNAAPRILQGAKRDAEREPLPADATQEGVLQTDRLSSWPRVWQRGGWQVTGSLTGTLGLFRMWNNAFDPPPAQNPDGNKRNPGWGEFFIEPGLNVEYAPNAATQLRAGVSYMETATRGTDYGGVSNTYHGGLELLLAGARWQDKAAGVTLDASYGRQDFAIGHDLLIAAGASNGAQRGADYMGPRSAWANAAVVKATVRDVTVQGFWLKPNDSTSADTGTRLAGVDAHWGGDGPWQAGFLYVRAPESNIVTRDGLDVYAVRGTAKPALGAGRLTLSGEYVWQRKDGVSASGWYVEGTWQANRLPWQPLAMLRYSSFSGDNPATPAWEGFDPLYYGGSTPDWYQGKLGSTLFNNTNLDAFVASLTLAPNPRNILQLIYLYFAAARTNSPLDIPAAGEPAPVGGGVPARALASEVDAIYTYTFNKNVNVNAFVGYAAPGAGYKQLYRASGGSASDWWIVGTQFNVSY